MTISASQWHCEVDIIVEVDVKTKKIQPLPKTSKSVQT
jgi:hypothetical protein